MSRKDKLLQRLREIPADFSWQELETLLGHLGYRVIAGDGSRVKFDNGQPEHLISLHKPHPGSIMKRYALRQVIEKLEKAGLL